MLAHFTPFGCEVRFLNDTITTAIGKEFNLKNKQLVKSVLNLTGIPHLGARLRAFHLNQLLHQLHGKLKILDAGCGIGLNTFLMAKKGFQIAGIDNDPEKISLAKKMLKHLNFPRTSFALQDITNMKFARESFDAIICFEVLEHVKEDNLALSEVSRVLKKGGLLLLSVPAKGPISQINLEAKGHVREGYTFRQLKTKLKSQNLSIEKVIAIEHTPLGFLVRYLNDEIRSRSLILSVVFFPIFFPLAILDKYLPTLIKPNNWIIVARKQTSSSRKKS